MNEVPSLLNLFLAVWPRVLTFDVGRYVVTAGVMALSVAGVMSTGWAVRRIQERRAKGRDYVREITSSLRTALMFSLVGFSIFAGREYGLFAEPPASTWTMTVVTLAAMVVVHDAYFYWTHRAMHHPALFKAFHRFHHQSVTPTPFTSYAFSVPETLVQAAFMPLWMIAVPTQNTTALIFMTIMIIRNVWGHAGVELHPRGMADHPVFGILSSTVHHDLHHAGGFNTNYGFYFTYWDRLMGTEHPDYRRRYREITERPVVTPHPAVEA